MAEPLKNQYGPEIPRKIAAMIRNVEADFRIEPFLIDALSGYDELELMPRARHLSRALRRHLPDDYASAIRILVASLGPKYEEAQSSGMAPFLYLPHVFFVGEYGLDEFELSMWAQYELTQRFTAEFSIRPYLIHRTEATLERLKTWTNDPSVHVRRLVSEGTRPRLPWAPRLPAFQENPRPVLELLELLKDDPELYVRRSVANNLNDIGKDNPLTLFETAKRWLDHASSERQWIVRHALRSAIKRGEKGALEVIGFSHAPQVAIRESIISPSNATIGDAVRLSFRVVNETSANQSVLLDLRVHYLKANGKPSPKVFKLKTLELKPDESATIEKKISLQEMTTRKHYPGLHEVELLLNGQVQPLGKFVLNRPES